jgi:hypothetical protein
MTCISMAYCGQLVPYLGFCDRNRLWCEGSSTCVLSSSGGQCLASADTVGATCDSAKGPSCDTEKGLGCDPTTSTCQPIVVQALDAKCNGGNLRCDFASCTKNLPTDPLGTCTDWCHEGKPCDIGYNPGCELGMVCVLPTGAYGQGTCRRRTIALCK